MADEISNNSDRTPTAGEKSFNGAPKVMSKATLVVATAAILFLIIFGILFFSFLNNPTGGSISNQNNTSSR